MNRIFIVTALAVALLGLAGGAAADPIVFVATLSGPNEEPPNASPGTGRAVVTLDLDTDFLRIEASFEGLTAGTTVAHIHAPTAEAFAGTVGVAVQPGTLTGFPSGVTSGVYDNTLDLGDSANYTAGFLNNFGGGTAEGAAAALAGYLASGQAYFNIHTSDFPAGEIRGFFSPVPEPSSLLLGAVGASGLVVLLARRRRARSA
ncbi:CHRD domain-containing protein [Tautonia plasticadhaerens]|uniref:CHRD domain protein n=1 Tax=Tautonia plasticadhaerens TaxID=2527974 RepID=A0A518HDB0_9BACT|nr:CHRD domain-containing protein [Tautonia plasticadhaerens]QDV38844.1 CHRD domain protein [Tautonia plasticadhaerens]